MNRIKAGVMALLVSGVVAGVPYQARAVSDADIDAKIQAARTAADHEEIAAYYDTQAKDARAKAEEHRRMAQDYRKTGAAAKAQLPEHCEGLVRAYTGAAKEYEALAKSHREMAKRAH